MDTVLLQIIAGLLGVLILLIGWIGNRIFQKIDEIINAMHKHELDDTHKFDKCAGDIALIKHKLNLT